MKKLKEFFTNLSKEKIIIAVCIGVAIIAIAVSTLLFISAMENDQNSAPKETERETVREETQRVTYPSDSPKSLEFKSNQDGTCAVVSIGGYSGDELEIPEKSPSGERVTSIAAGAFEGCDQLLSIYIPYTVETIGDGAFRGCSSLVMIRVESGNSNFSASGGILFSKNKSVLICYPADRVGSTYLLNPNVTTIADHAFYGVKHLNKINYEGSATDFAAIAVGTGNKAFTDLPITCNYYSAK